MFTLTFPGGGILGGSRPPPLPPPVYLPPPSAPEQSITPAPAPVDPAVKKAKNQSRIASLRRRGRKSTILTSPLGDSGSTQKNQPRASKLGS